MKPTDNSTDKQLYAVQGMSCTSCAKHVEEVLMDLPRVQTAVVNLAAEQVEVSIEQGVERSNEIIQAIEEAGYSAQAL